MAKAKPSWYAVKTLTDDKAEISILDEIGLFGITAKEFTTELKGLGNRRITLRINSPGGEIFEGNAIYNALRQHKAGVDVEISALAASMASVIAMVGEKRSIAENGMFMIHNPWAVEMGESKDLARTAGVLDDLKETIISAYAGRTGMERKKLSTMMDEETWLTSKEALEFRFVTEITEPLHGYNAAFPALSKFGRVPEGLSIMNLQNSLQLRTKERDAARDSLAKAKTLIAHLEPLLDSLERRPAHDEAKSPYDKWMAMPTGNGRQAEAKAAYYTAHREEIMQGYRESL